MRELVPSFFDELSKIAAIRGIENMRTKRRLDYFFSPKAGSERWDKFDKFVRSPVFLEGLAAHSGSDDKMLQYAKSLHDLSRAPTEGKVESSKGKGLRYEIKKLPDGRYGCTCNDWKYKGSVDPTHECKHIKAFKAGKTSVA